ncbi:hypothetical protein [Comamonas sp. JNW]|uniref:hypothetical protein n=1 Tax=Comamonas sp. JNW TaxID=2170731 RepID=UPI000DE62FBE|nr:hypothetical protein [Comamonas sp. JNW]PWB19604.1 hypothetical protein DCO45_06585 [Comamonas sp. JNW]
MVMAIVALLMKQNMGVTKAPAPAAVEGVRVPQIDTSKDVNAQSRQIQQQVQDQLNQAVQQDAQRLKQAEE